MHNFCEVSESSQAVEFELELDSESGHGNSICSNESRNATNTNSDWL